MIPQNAQKDVIAVDSVTAVQPTTRRHAPTDFSGCLASMFNSCRISLENQVMTNLGSDTVCRSDASSDPETS